MTFRNNNFRPHFRDILEQWVKNISKYTNKTDNYDALYWYNERATLSTFAGAVWQKGHYALEEFSFQKQSSSQEYWTGRADLWILRGSKEYIIESKQIFNSISKRVKETYNDKIVASLKNARQDASSSNKKGLIPLGFVFFVPVIPPSEYNIREELIEEFVNNISEIDYDFMAYSFPSNSQVKATDSQYFYPGVVLFARVPRR